MDKHSSKKAEVVRQVSEGPKEVAFSVRLTAEEHEILRQAAVMRGWTPTNLIRTATLERAKHILNTSRVTTFNFKVLAMSIADQLFKPRTYEVPFGDDLVEMNEAQLTEETGVRPDLSVLPISKLADLRQAVNFGGGEFLNQILEYCESLTASRRSDVPQPIDPSAQ